MSDSLSDEETNCILSQINMEGLENMSEVFDVESDLILSQFDMDSFLKEEKNAGNLPYTQSLNVAGGQEKGKANIYLNTIHIAFKQNSFFY